MRCCPDCKGTGSDCGWPIQGCRRCGGDGRQPGPAPTPEERAREVALTVAPKCQTCDGRGLCHIPNDNAEGCDDCDQTGRLGVDALQAALLAFAAEQVREERIQWTKEMFAKVGERAGELAERVAAGFDEPWSVRAKIRAAQRKALRELRAYLAIVPPCSESGVPHETFSCTGECVINDAARAIDRATRAPRKARVR